MVWVFSQFKIEDIDSDRTLFEIPVSNEKIVVSKFTIPGPRFFKPHFFTEETSDKGYYLLLRGSTGLRRLPLKGGQESAGNFEDLCMISEYAISSFYHISDDLAQLTSFSEWDSPERLNQYSEEMRTVLDNLQADIINGFYKSAMRWSLNGPSKGQHKYLSELLQPFREQLT